MPSILVDLLGRLPGDSYAMSDHVHADTIAISPKRAVTRSMLSSPSA